MARILAGVSAGWSLFAAGVVAAHGMGLLGALAVTDGPTRVPPDRLAAAGVFGLVAAAFLTAAAGRLEGIRRLAEMSPGSALERDDERTALVSDIAPRLAVILAFGIVASVLSVTLIV